MEMLLEDIATGLKNIEAAKDDPEVAYGMEDRLYRDLLQSIAEGSCAVPDLCAAAVLKSQDIDFPRWCA